MPRRPTTPAATKALPPTPIAAPGRAAIEAALGIPPTGRGSTTSATPNTDPHAGGRPLLHRLRPRVPEREGRAQKRLIWAADDLGADAVAGVIGSPDPPLTQARRPSTTPPSPPPASTGPSPPSRWRRRRRPGARRDAGPGPGRPVGHHAPAKDAVAAAVDELERRRRPARRGELRRAAGRRPAAGREHRRPRLRAVPGRRRVRPGRAPVLCVLGAGGAARAVVLALARAGASAVVVVNRTAAKAEAAAALAGGVGSVAVAVDPDAELVVNATSVGMGEDRSLPLDPERLQAGQWVADLVYVPIDTPLLVAARAAGCRHGRRPRHARAPGRRRLRGLEPASRPRSRRCDIAAAGVTQTVNLRVESAVLDRGFDRRFGVW